jgi:transcription antitermination factor NusG
MSNDYPSVVRKDIIEDIKSRQDDSGLVAIEKGFTFKQRVRIVDGVFSEGLYLGMSDKHRVRVLFELLGKELTKDINIKRVRPLEANL